MKRIICAILVALMALSVFAACTDSKKTTGAAQTGAVQTGGTKVTDSGLDEWGREYVASAIPDGKKFSGETVNFVYDNYVARKSDLCADSLNGDLINDAIYNRNLKVESDLGVKLNFILLQGGNNTSFASSVSRIVLSGTGDYDLIAGADYYMTSAVRTWCYANLKEVEEASSLDLTKPWWNQLYVNECTVYDQLYTVTGDLTTFTNATCCCIFFNKRLAEEHLGAWGGTEGLYRLVENKEWTIDKFTEICKDVYNDDDGDGQRSEGDLYAFASWWSGPLPSDAFIAGMEAHITGKDENNVPVLDFFTPRAVAAVQKLWDLNNSGKGVLYSQSYYNNGTANDMLQQKFIKGELVFYSERLDLATKFSQMLDDYGLLPMPKFNKEQENYYTSSHNLYPSFAVAADVVDRGVTDLVGTTLEMLAEGSYRTVTPNYFETVMKYRYLRTDAQNQKDIAMYDLIVKGNSFNFGSVYSYTLNNIIHAYRYLVGRDNSPNLESFWRSNESTVTTKLESLLSDFEDM